MGKKKEKKVVEIDPNALTEVDKQFYELEIADRNRLIARLRTLNSDLEENTVTLQKEIETIKDDQGEIIIFLKRTIQEKNDEISQLHEEIRVANETRTAQTEETRELINDMKDDYKVMKEQLVAEIKMLEGKTSALEDYRIHKQDLMANYADMENRIAEQETRHKREIYEAEKKLIRDKDKLKKDMEMKLLELSTEFHDVTEVRIAATTHRTIRENIAINNELSKLLKEHNDMYLNEKEMKKRNNTFGLEVALHEEEKTKAVKRCLAQQKLIDQLTDRCESLEKKLERYENMDGRICEAYNKLDKAERDRNEAELKVKILEQNLQAGKAQNISLETDLDYYKTEMNRLSNILQETTLSLKTVIKISKQHPNRPEIIADARERFFCDLLALMAKVKKYKPTRPSLQTIRSVQKEYAAGDIGYISVKDMRPKIQVGRTAESQVGDSLEELVPVRTMVESEPTIVGEFEEVSSHLERVSKVSSLLSSSISSSETTSSETESKESIPTRGSEEIKEEISTTEILKYVGNESFAEEWMDIEEGDAVSEDNENQP